MKIYNKLVRDKIPEIIETSGKKVNYRVLPQEEYKQALKDKLLEEVNEFLAAKTKLERMEEIADIMTVVGVIMEAYNINIDAFDSVYDYKLQTKGEFAKRYFLESVED